MKSIFIFCSAALFTLQSCIKTDELGIVCKHALDKPILALADTVFVQQGQYFTASITNKPTTLGYSYIWKGPGNYTSTSSNGDISFYATSSAQSGTYTIACRQTDTGCTSEETPIVVIVEVPTNSCFISANTFTPGGGIGIYSFSSANIITNVSYSFARWENSSSETVTVRFGLKPGSTTKNHMVLDVSDPQQLGDNESEISCTINGIGYAGISGYVKTSYISGKYNVEFCNVLLKRVGASTYYSDCKGNLTYQ